MVVDKHCIQGLPIEPTSQTIHAPNMVFLCAYVGIAISVYPYLVSNQLTIWQGAAPESTLSFILMGELLTFPVLLTYTAFAYHVFRGKSFAAYHHEVLMNPCFCAFE